jgi:hypothetical protein
MPEEHNRVMLDHISEYLFTTNDGGRENLEADNVAGDIHMSGNPIVDAAVQNREIAREQSDALARFGLTEGEYALMTLHREENVDTEENLRDALHGVDAVTDQFDMPVLFLAHPRTQDRIEEFGRAPSIVGLARRVAGVRAIEIGPPLGEPPPGGQRALVAHQEPDRGSELGVGPQETVDCDLPAALVAVRADDDRHLATLSIGAAGGRILDVV